MEKSTIDIKGLNHLDQVKLKLLITEEQIKLWGFNESYERLERSRGQNIHMYYNSCLKQARNFFQSQLKEQKIT